MSSSYKRDFLPKVSCLCITFARPSLLEEAIQSFLNQDYAGEKELIVLNDFHLQTLSFEHPQVNIINLPLKVNTLGEKRNMAAALSSGSVLLPWDDDDICLSSRVSQSVDYLLNNEQQYYKPKSVFFWNNGIISSLEQYHCHGQCCYTRELFDKTLYSVMGSGEDQAFDNKAKDILGKEDLSTDIALIENFYFYRWAGTHSYHISTMDKQGGEPTLFAQSIESVKRGEMPQGNITLSPHWKADYEQQAKNFIATKNL